MPQPDENRQRLNGEIRAREVRVVDPDAPTPEEKSRIMSTRDALELAERRGLDLVEIAPNAAPPVVKIMDYGKFRYEQTKREKEARKKQHVILMKEVRFHPHTDTHDFDFKVKHAVKFLEEGNKVKAAVVFKGREIVYQQNGRIILERFLEELQDLAKVEQAPKMEGRSMTIILAPEAKPKPVKPKAPRPAAQPGTPVANAPADESAKADDDATPDDVPMTDDVPTNDDVPTTDDVLTPDDALTLSDDAPTTDDVPPTDDASTDDASTAAPDESSAAA